MTPRELRIDDASGRRWYVREVEPGAWYMAEYAERADLSLCRDAAMADMIWVDGPYETADAVRVELQLRSFVS